MSEVSNTKISRIRKWAHDEYIRKSVHKKVILWVILAMIHYKTIHQVTSLTSPGRLYHVFWPSDNTSRKGFCTLIRTEASILSSATGPACVVLLRRYSAFVGSHFKTTGISNHIRLLMSLACFLSINIYFVHLIRILMRDWAKKMNAWSSIIR